MKQVIEIFDGEEAKDSIMFTHRDWEDFIEEFQLEELAKLLDRKEHLSITVPVTQKMIDIIEAAYKNIPPKSEHSLFDWFINLKSALRDYKKPVLEVRLTP
jgi:hypothetical protein